MGPTLKIAVADDEPEVRDYFAKALSGLGHDVVVVASNGRELVEKCRLARPDLLITDIRMDELSGIEAVKQLASESPILTILISAHYRPEDLDGDLDHGVMAFLPKPVKLADLAAAVAEVAARIL